MESILQDETITRWALTGLNENDTDAGVYNLSKLLNNQANTLQRLVRDKIVYPSCPSIQLLLSLTSRFGQSILNNPKIEIISDTEVPFFDNPNITVYTTNSTIPVIVPCTTEKECLQYDNEFLQSHEDEILEYLIPFYSDLIDDPQVNTVFIFNVLNLLGPELTYVSQYATWKTY